MSMRSSIRVLTVASVLLAFSVSSWAVSPQEKMQHYCTNWGAAGLFPDDQAKVKSDPMAAMAVDLGGGKIVRIKYLYIEKGYRLESQPIQWAEIWRAFASACPRWQRPAWVQKLEAWKQTKANPLAARRKARVRKIEATIRSKEAELAQLLRRVQGSPEYLQITGGTDTWYEAATNKAGYLRQIVSLSKTTYSVMGRVESRSQNGVFVVGMGLSKAPGNAPGNVTTSARLFVLNPAPRWIRPNQNFFGEGLYLQALVDHSNPQLVYGPRLNQEATAQVRAAKAALKKVRTLLKTGRKKLNKMMRPVKRIESSLAKLRAELTKLQSEQGQR